MGILSKAAVRTARDRSRVPGRGAAEREALGDTGTRLVDSTCKYVAAHPLQSLGLALMAGYMIGRLAGLLSPLDPRV